MRRIIPLTVVIVIVVGGWYLFAPRVASHFGWATSWPGRMPTKLSYSGREYANPTGCPVRLQTPLRAGHSRRVGTVPELFGAAVPIYAAGSHRPADPAEIAIIAKPGSSCYVVYGLQGGP